MSLNQLKKITTFLKIIGNNDIIEFDNMLKIDEINRFNNLNLLLSISSNNVDYLFRAGSFEILDRIFAIEELDLSRLVTEYTILAAIKSNNVDSLSKILSIKGLNMLVLIKTKTIVYALESNNIRILDLILRTDELHVSSLINNSIIIIAININNVKILDRILEIKSMDLSSIMSNRILPPILNSSINNNFELVVENTFNKNISVTILNKILGIIDYNVFIDANYIQLCNFIIRDPLSIFENSLGINKNKYDNIIKIIYDFSHINYNLYKSVNRLLTMYKSKSNFCNDINRYIASYCI
jgi:hypothetical protein